MGIITELDQLRPTKSVCAPPELRHGRSALSCIVCTAAWERCFVLLLAWQSSSRYDVSATPRVHVHSKAARGAQHSWIVYPGWWCSGGVIASLRSIVQHRMNMS